MDLRKAILQEHTRARATKIADHVGQNKALFKELVEVYLAGPYRVTQRAAWPLSICAERYPSLVRPHLTRLLRYLDKPGIHPAVKRNTMRMLQFIEIPRSQHAAVIELGFRYLRNKQEPIAVKVFAMTALSRVVKTQPELGRELRIILEDLLPYSSPAFVSRARRVLKDLHGSL